MDIISLALLSKLKKQVSTLETAHISGITLENGVLKFELDSGDEFSITMPATDTTLTQTGSAADAATVGQIVSEIAAEINTLTNALAAKADAQATQTAISNLETALETMGAQLTFDERPTPGSTKGVTSRGIYHWGNEFLDPIDAVIGDPGSEVEISEGTVVIQPNIGFRSLVVAQLPDEGQPGILYFVAHPGAAEPNVYDEFVWTENRFEQVGTTGGGDASIDDDVISTDSTWSSAKINNELHPTQWVNCTKPTPVADHLYEITYSDWDQDAALEYYNSLNSSTGGAGGACTAVRKGNQIGRNFDWHYDNEAEFIIKCQAGNGRHASIGVVGNVTGILDSAAQAQQWDDMYNILPYHTVDGINDAGVFVEVNVVDATDHGPTTGTNPDAEVELAINMVARYVLDNASSAAQAIEMLENCNIHASKPGEEFHWMIADVNETYEVEIVDNTMEVSVMDKDFLETESGNLPPIVTNFFLTNWTLGDLATASYNTGEWDPETTTLNTHAVGIERYGTAAMGLCTPFIPGGEDVPIEDIMASIHYSQYYEREDDDWVYDEFNGIYPNGVDLSIYSPAEDYDFVIEGARAAYERHERDGSIWITCHTSIYDLETKSLKVCSQESGEYNEVSFPIPVPVGGDGIVITNVMPAPETGKYVMYNGNEDGYVNSALYKTETIDGTQKWVSGFVNIKENKVTRQVFVPLIDVE